MKDVLCNTKYLQLKTTTTTFGNEWVYSHRPNAKDVVVILPYTNDSILFLVEERPPLIAEKRGEYTIGLPAGLVGDERIEESTLDAIKSELLEETGLVAEAIKIVGKNIASSPGCVSETATIAIAKIINTEPVAKPIDDGGIIKDRIWIKKNQIYHWLNDKSKEGYAISSQTLAALYFYKEEGEK